MSQATQSLRHRGSPLAAANEQLAVLAACSGGPPFDQQVTGANGEPLQAEGVEILQVNLGKLCNMACAHCHVDAGPDRREVMRGETVEACLDVLRRHRSVRTLDLTGGAPEMNGHFRDLVREARRLGRHVIDRCNLTILLAKGHEDLPEFLAENHVEVVASLPCYLAENTDAQRGDGAFGKSIDALQRLNALGYGAADSGRVLTLVYNPVGPSLPPDQASLEQAYRRELSSRYGVRFNRLITITNMPISRYLEHLVRTEQIERYMQTLVEAFNPATLDGVMCRNTLSVGWDGRLFDCDFNQMLDLPLADESVGHIRDFQYETIAQRKIVTGQHCYGCTAGAGSSCQGATA